MAGVLFDSRRTGGGARGGALHWLLPAAVIGAATCFFVFKAPPSPYFLDSPEFVSAAWSLSLSHPPGHPLYAPAAKLFTLVPVGSIALRVNLFSTVCAAAALLFVFLACRGMMRDGFGCGRGLSSACASLALVPLALSPGWAHQAAHAEVYAFETMLLAAAVWLLSRHLQPRMPEPGNAPVADDDRGPGWLLAGLFVFFLSMGNHPFITLLVLPALAAAIPAAALRRKWERPGRAFLLIAALAAAAALVYLYIPVRGAVEPGIVMGRIETAGDFLWTVSAKVYQKSATLPGPGVVAQKEGAALAMLLEESGALLPFVAAGGVFFLLRRRRLVPAGLLIAVAALCGAVSRGLMPFDRSAPDVFGYMMFILPLEAVAACCFAGAVARLRGGKVAGVLVVAAAGAAAAFVHAPRLGAQARAAGCAGSVMYHVVEKDLGRMAPGARSFTTFYATTFADLYARTVLALRPDVTDVGVSFLGYRGVAAHVTGTSGELTRVVRSFLVEGDLNPADMAALSLDWPVYVEAWPDMPDDLVPYLSPAGGRFRLSPQHAPSREIAQAADETNAQLAAALKKIGACAAEPQATRNLLWLLYSRSLLIARSSVDGAIRGAELGLAVSPQTPQLKLLVKTLARTGKPIRSARPYLPPALQ